MCNKNQDHFCRAYYRALKVHCYLCSEFELIILMFCPEIALHKNINVMKEIENIYVKRMQKDYSMSFKLSVVLEIEHGSAKKNYGVQGD